MVGRVSVLLMKEIKQGATNFFFAYALVMPIILSLIVTLVFGDLFSQMPRLGVYDVNQSTIADELLATEHITVTAYASETALRDAVERGVVTAGVIFAEDFASRLADGQVAEMRVIYWSESLPSDSAIISSRLLEVIDVAHSTDSGITLEEIQLGEGTELDWSERLLPMIVLMTIVLGGVLVPAASLVDEKQKRTLTALIITPASLVEVYIAKALLGITISVVMGLVVLVLNNAFGGQPALLVTVLGMGAIASSVFGVLLGSFVKDINVLLAVIKAGGLLILAPGLVTFIPDAPSWLARIFPTFYMMNPVLEVSQNGATFTDIAPDLAVLLAIIGVMLLGLALVIERQQKTFLGS